MTVNETKEVMVHAYAYCGFPAACVVCRPPSCKCSTSAKRGASPTLWGATRRPVCDSRDKHTRGAELLEKLSGAPADAPKTGYAAFAPPSLIGT